MNTSNFPTGQEYVVDYGGDFVFKLHYISETELSYTGLAGQYKGLSETVQLQVTPLRPSLFMLSWQEASKNTIIHIEDFENEVSYANITLPDMTFVRLKGSLKKH